MQEQLARNKELTQKLQVASNSEEEEEGVEEEGDLVPDAVNEIQMDADGPNPWMLRNHSRGTKEAKGQDPEQLPEPVAHEASESEEEEDRPGAEEETLLNEFEERRSLRRKSGLNQDAEPVSRQEPKGKLWWTGMENCSVLVFWTDQERKTVHAHVQQSHQALGTLQRILGAPEKKTD